MPALVSALGIAAVCAPAWAQEKVTRLDYGFSYVIPHDYRQDPVPGRLGLGDSPIALIIKEGTTTQTLNESSSGYTNLSIVSSIRLLILPATQRIISPSTTSTDDKLEIDENAVKRLVDTLSMATKPGGTTLDYQKSAAIKVSGEDALAIRCNGYTERLNAAFTARLILMPHKEKMYLFIFGALNDEFEEKVPAFNQFMNSFKFLKPPGAKPAPKPAPKKPTKKKG
ncbi:MAG: hypothetical protein QM758_09565 [Armatimonas sp.]